MNGTVHVVSIVLVAFVVVMYARNLSHDQDQLSQAQSIPNRSISTEHELVTSTHTPSFPH